MYESYSLYMYGIAESRYCTLCNIEIETIDHSFCECGVVKPLAVYINLLSKAIWKSICLSSNVTVTDAKCWWYFYAVEGNRETWNVNLVSVPSINQYNWMRDVLEKEEGISCFWLRLFEENTGICRCVAFRICFTNIMSGWGLLPYNHHHSWFVCLQQ